MSPSAPPVGDAVPSLMLRLTAVPKPRAAKAWGTIDFVVHAIAFSDKHELDGRYVDTSPDNFSRTLAVSCYSFVAIAQRAPAARTISRTRGSGSAVPSK